MTEQSSRPLEIDGTQGWKVTSTEGQEDGPPHVLGRRRALYACPWQRVQVGARKRPCVGQVPVLAMPASDATWRQAAEQTRPLNRPPRGSLTLQAKAVKYPLEPGATTGAAQRLREVRERREMAQWRRV